MGGRGDAKLEREIVVVSHLDKYMRRQTKEGFEKIGVLILSGCVCLFEKSKRMSGRLRYTHVERRVKTSEACIPMMKKKILQNNSACSGQHLSQSGPSDAVVVLESIVRVVGYLF